MMSSDWDRVNRLCIELQKQLEPALHDVTRERLLTQPNELLASLLASAQASTYTLLATLRMLEKQSSSCILAWRMEEEALLARSLQTRTGAEEDSDE